MFHIVIKPSVGADAYIGPFGKIVVLLRGDVGIAPYDF